MKRNLFVFLFGILLISWKSQLIDLEKKSIFNDKIEILMPKGFEIMGQEMLNFKYPSERRPTLVYTEPTGSINIAFNHTASKASQKQINAYKQSFVSLFKVSHPTAKLNGSGVKEINGRKIGYLELETEAIDTNIYNLIFFTDFEDRLLLCTFNCTVEKQKDWVEPAQLIMNSLIIK